MMDLSKISNVKELIDTLMIEYRITKGSKQIIPVTHVPSSDRPIDQREAELSRLKDLSEEKSRKCT